MGINLGMVSLMLFVLGGYVITLQRSSFKEIEVKNKALKTAEAEQEMAYQELRAQEEELRQNTEELMISNEALNEVQFKLKEALDSEKAAKADLEKAKDSEIAKQNLKIKQSIRVAKRIQQAMLPGMDEFKKAFPESFIYFKPMDIVSGDVYWSFVKGDKHVVAAVDCTGHGVPGAILSMIAFEQLVEIVNLYGITDPGKILTTLHQSVVNILKQEKGEGREGMDIGLCTYDIGNKTLQFAGAKRPLFYVQGGKGHVVNGDKMPIGGKAGKGLGFTTHDIPINRSTWFYLFSDGYQDQFGGPDGRKFMAKRMKNMLTVNHHLPMKEQKAILDESMQDWLKGHKQIDDMLVIGCQVPF
jgi:serine phosphatase RsbU (regulator of sigma subunit)